PIPTEEAMLDYHIVEETTAPDRVLLAVAYRDLVDRFAATCAAAKIELLGIDIEAFALPRAVAGEPLPAGQRAEAALVAVSIGHDRTTVAVSDGRVCEFTRVLDWGGVRVTAAIERALEVNAEEADRIKRSLDISSHAPKETDDAGTTKAVEATRREINGLARELASSLHFYQDQPDSRGCAEITITGGGAHLQGLAEQLAELLAIRVRVAAPFAPAGAAVARPRLRHRQARGLGSHPPPRHARHARRRVAADLDRLGPARLDECDNGGGPHHPDRAELERAAAGTDGAHDPGLHVLARWGSAAPGAARGDPGPAERPTRDQPVTAGRQPHGHQFHDRVRHPEGKGSIVTERLSSLSTKAQVALVVAGLLLVAVIGYFAV